MGQVGAIVRKVIAAALGGAAGGALVGLIEATVVTATAGAPEEYWLFPFAVVSYGLFGAACGLVYPLAAALLRKRTDNVLGGAAAVAIFLLGLAVARYHVIQRIFHEDLVLLSGTGLAVHAALVFVVAAVALILMRASRPLQRQRGGLVLVAASLVVCIVFASGAAVLASAHAEPAPMRSSGGNVKGHPNIVLIIVDTLRADALGVQGGSAGASPDVDRFAREAVRFEHAYSQATWTRASIATILTSLYPSMHGAVHKMDVLPVGVTTLAEALHAQGYWAAGFVSNINVAPVFNFQRGFDEYTYLAPDFYFGATDSATRLAIYKGLREIHERLFRNHIYFYHYYQDAQVVGTAVHQWLAQHPPQPFFLFIHYMDPHDPYFEIPYNGRGVARVTTPNPAPERKDELHKLYGEDVTYLDGHLGGLFKELKAGGLYDNTVIAVTADHGEEFQEHGGWWHGTTLYEEQMHVPLIIKRAHESEPGRVDSRVVRSLDIAPTLMAGAGLEASSSFVGHDLFGGADGGNEPLFAEEDFEGNVLAALRVGFWKVITANPSNPRGLPPVELYDLSQDPTERQNVAAAQSAKTEEMLQLLMQARARIGERLNVSDGPHAADHRS